MSGLTENIDREDAFADKDFIVHNKYDLRTIDIKDYNKIKEVKVKLYNLCSIKNAYFVKYKCYFIFEAQKKFNLAFDKFPFLFGGTDVKFEEKKDIIVAFSGVCIGVKEYHDKNIYHGRININNIFQINPQYLVIGEIDYNNIFEDDNDDKRKKDIIDLGMLLFKMFCVMQKKDEEYSQEKLARIIDDPNLRELIISILENRENPPSIEDILEKYLMSYDIIEKKNENNPNGKYFNKYSLINENNVSDSDESSLCPYEKENYPRINTILTDSSDEIPNNEILDFKEKSKEGQDGKSFEFFEEDEKSIEPVKKPCKKKAKDDEEKIKIRNEFIEESLNKKNNKCFKKCLYVAKAKYKIFNEELKFSEIFETTTAYTSKMDIKNISNIIINGKTKINLRKLSSSLCFFSYICICWTCSYVVCPLKKLPKSPLLRAFKSLKQFYDHKRKRKDHEDYTAILNASLKHNDEWSLISFRTNGYYHFIKTARINYKTVKEIIDVI